MRIEGPGQPPKPNPSTGAEPGKGKATFEALLRRKTAANLPGGEGSDSPPDGPLPYPGTSPSTRAAEAGSEPSGDRAGRGERDPRDGGDAHDGERSGEADRGRERETRAVESPTERPAEPQAPIGRPGEPARGATGGTGLRIPTEVYHRLVESVRLVKHESGVKELNVALRSPGYEGMSVRVLSSQGRVTTTFVVESLAQQRALEAQLPDLRARLEAQGVQVAEVTVELRPGMPSAMGGDAGGPGYQHGGGGASEHGDGAEGRAQPARPDATGDPRSEGEERTDYTL